MAKLTNKELIESFKKFIGDRTDDDALKMLEDFTDTITDDGDDWKTKYEQAVEEKKLLDESWRTKYKERFYSADTNINNNTNNNNNDNTRNDPNFDTRSEEEKKAESITIDDLFKSE